MNRSTRQHSVLSAVPPNSHEMAGVQGFYTDLVTQSFAESIASN